MASTKLYTVHEKADLAEPSARVVLVREGFAWLAFIFGGLWLLARGLWVAVLGYFLLLVAIVYIAQSFGLSEETMLVLQFFVQLMLGFSANDLIRESLGRRGYAFQGVIAAESPLSAEQRYLDGIA